MQTNNLSFKGVFLFPSIENISSKNRDKVNEGIKMTESLFPNNDVFLGADNKGELTMHVQQRNPLTYLLDPEVANRMNVSDSELVNCVNTVIAINGAHRELWGEKMPFVDDKTDGIDTMKSFNLVEKMHQVVTDFNKQFRKSLN